jgi:GxxExxY protein
MTTNEIAHAIVGAAMEVHKLLGPGLLESAYEECLAREMVLRGIPFERQKPVPVVYKDVKLERGYRLDFLVDRHVVVELKSIGAVAPIHEAHPHLSAALRQALWPADQLQRSRAEGWNSPLR